MDDVVTLTWTWGSKRSFHAPCSKSANENSGSSVTTAWQQPQISYKNLHQFTANWQISTSVNTNAWSFFFKYIFLLPLIPRTREKKLKTLKALKGKKKKPRWEQQTERWVMGVSDIDYNTISDKHNYNGDSKKWEGGTGEEEGWAALSRGSSKGRV